MKYLLLILALLSPPVLAETKMNLGLFLSDLDSSHGAIIGIEGGESLLYRVEVNIAANLGGPSAAVGYKFGPINVYLGYLSIVRMDKIGAFVDVGGVPVYDDQGDGTGDGVFLDLRYKKLFIRYTEYDVDFYHRAVRIENGIQIEGRQNTNVSDSALWVGLLFQF